MAQEDTGLVLRGLLLLSAIGVLVLIVLTILFWRPQTTPMSAERPSEYDIVAVVTPDAASFPSGISWAALVQLAETMPSAPGWDIRYNAAATLARRGSDKVPWHLIREMLDLKHQMRNNRVRLPDGRDVYDEASARATTLSALRAVAAWHEKRREDKKRDTPAELAAVHAAVDRLTQSPFVEVKVQAEKARVAFSR